MYLLNHHLSNLVKVREKNVKEIRVIMEEKRTGKCGVAKKCGGCVYQSFT